MFYVNFIWIIGTAIWNTYNTNNKSIRGISSWWDSYKEPVCGQTEPSVSSLITLNLNAPIRITISFKGLSSLNDPGKAVFDQIILNIPRLEWLVFHILL